MKMKNQNKKAVKALAVSMFAVGFVTPLMFSNIAEAANYGAGGSTTPTFTAAQIEAAYAYKSTGKSSISNDNCLMINGYRFKVVGNTTTNGKQILTLWSYDKQDHGGTTGFGTSRYSSGSTWCTGAIDQAKIQAAYNNNVISTNTNALLTVDTATGKATAGKLYGDEASKNIVYVPYTSTGITNEADVSNAYIWLPSKTEVTSTAWGDGTTALTDAQRAVGSHSWLRSPHPGNVSFAYYVTSSGYIVYDYVASAANVLRPALQILNQTSWVFTANDAINTDGVFTADAGSDTAASFALNSSVDQPTFTPSDGVTLDGTKIVISVGDNSEGTYAIAGLLTTNSGTTWEAINTGDNANIAYMAQVKDCVLDLQNVDAGTDYNLKIFGLNTEAPLVTQLADNAVQGLSIVGTEEAKIHMKIGGTYNNGVPVILTNGASADLAGTANNDITVTDTGCLGGEGTLTGKVDGDGKLSVTGAITAAADRFTQKGGLEVNNNLVFTSNDLNVSTVGGFTQAAGSNVVVPATVIESDTNDEGKAMFTGVDSIDDLNVASGNLTIDGQVTDGKYYVLVAGDAVANEDLTATNLWKKENITLDTSKYLLADYDYVTSDNAIAVKVQAATVEEANTSGLAAAQQSNITVAKEFTSEVENHLSLINRPSLKNVKVEVRDVANTNKDDYKVETVEQGNANEVMPTQVEEKDKYDKEVWASYIRTKETTEGMKLGEGLEGNNTAQYNGAVVGADFYTSKKAIAGVAFSYTTGDIDSFSGTTATRNKSKYYGVSFYDRVTNGNTALIYDIGYIRGNNDVSQFYTGQETTADVKTDTYTAGVRYEVKYGTKKSRVVPFASFRYMRQNNKDYTNSHNTRFESKNQNLYIPKVGIAWTGDFAMPQCEWTWRPSVEAGYVWNLGDRSVDGNVFLGSTIAPLEYDTVDKSSYYAKAGMEFINKNFTAGVFYRYLKGNAVRNNKWNVNVAWSF